MKDYDLIVIENGCFKTCIIFSTNYISPVKSFREIQTLYQDVLNECDEIYYDFLLCRKNRNERYAKVNRGNGTVDLSQFSYVEIKKKDDLRRISAQFYRENADRLDWTYADPLKMKLISRGLVI